MTAADSLLWAFVALACVAALALVFSAWPRWMKALLVIGVTALYFYGEPAFDNVRGQPGKQSLPERFLLQVRQGVSQMGSAEPKTGPKGFSWLRPGSDEQAVKIRDLPVPQLPEK